jgi:hypothetical protein
VVHREGFEPVTVLVLSQAPPASWATGAIMSDGAARGHRTPDRSRTKGELCQLSSDGECLGKGAAVDDAPHLEPRPGIEHGSAAYKAAASPQCFWGVMVLAGWIEHPASALRERRSSD